jgi:hypothetical protein
MRVHSGRTDQFKASLHRNQDAKELHGRKRWRAAMYLFGYAVECGLKAKLMERYGFRHLLQLQQYLSEKTGKEVNLYTHSLDTLMNWTEAQGRMEPGLRVHWAVVRQWRVDWRYSPDESSKEECSQFSVAVEKVLTHIRRNV